MDDSGGYPLGLEDGGYRYGDPDEQSRADSFRYSTLTLLLLFIGVVSSAETENYDAGAMDTSVRSESSSASSLPDKGTKNLNEKQGTIC